MAHWRKWIADRKTADRLTGEVASAAGKVLSEDRPATPRELKVIRDSHATARALNPALGPLDGPDDLQKVLLRERLDATLSKMSALAAKYDDEGDFGTGVRVEALEALAYECDRVAAILRETEG
jgi:hypothetical protein